MSDIIRRAAGYGLCDICDESFDSSTVLTQIFPWRSAAMADAWMCDDCRNKLVLELVREVIRDADHTYELRFILLGELMMDEILKQKVGGKDHD